MSHVPNEALPYFENAIYLPMLLKILEKDRLIIEITPFKLKRPYIKIVDAAIENIQKELKETNIYLKQNKMQLIKKGTDKDFTEFIFLSGGYEDKRRYFNIRLRNHTEELMGIYLMKGEGNNDKTPTGNLRVY